MHKKLEILRILNNMMLPFVLASVLFICAGMPADSALFAGNLLLVLFVVISEAVQYLFSRIDFFLMGHIGGIILCTVMSEASGNQHKGFTITRVAFMIAMTIIAINAKLGKGVYFYPTMPEAFLFVGLMIAAKLSGIKEVELIVLFGEIFWGILAVIFYNTRQTAAAISVFKDRDRVPYESILRTNRLMLGICLGISLAFMFLSVLFDYGKQIMDAVGAVMVSFLRWFFSLLDLTVEEEQYVPPSSQGLGQMGLMPIGYDDSLLHILWDVLFWTMGIAVTVGFIFFLIKAIKFFIRYFNERRIGIRDRLSRDKVEYLKPAFDEKSGFGGTGRNNRIPLSKRLSNRGQVRLLYKRFIKRGSGFVDVRKSHTPQQQLGTACGDLTCNSEIRALYEKARYSEAEVTSEDVKTMRKMSR